MVAIKKVAIKKKKKNVFNGFKFMVVDDNIYYYITILYEKVNSVAYCLFKDEQRQLNQTVKLKQRFFFFFFSFDKPLLMEIALNLLAWILRYFQNR